LTGGIILSSYANAQTEYIEYVMEGRACAACKNRIKEALQCTIDGAQCDLVNNCVRVPSGKEIIAQELITAIEPGVELVEAQRKTKSSEGTMFQAVRRQIALLVLASALFAGGFASHHLLPFCPWIPTACFLASYLLVGHSVIRTALKHLTAGKFFDENFLMTIASVGAVAVGHPAEAAGVMLFYRVGEFLQDRAVNKSRGMIKSLMDIRPDTANLKTDGNTVSVPAETVQVGQTILVKAGEKVPLDGIVVEGSSFLDTSALTGEHVPKRVNPGEQVLAGSVNSGGLLEIKVSHSYTNSSVSKMLELVEKAGERKAHTEQFITRFSRYYTPVVVLMAAGVAVLPPLLVTGAHFSDWFYRALIMLVVSCPCDLVISIPLGYFGGIGGASRNGILIKGANYLDALTQVDTVAFDKTGTLTKGEFKVTEIEAYNGYTQKDVIQLAAAVEFYSNHPIASSILEYYSREYGISATSEKGVQINEFHEIPGKGVKATVNGQRVCAGNDELVKGSGIPCPESETFGTAVFVTVNDTLAGRILISDTIREEAPPALRRLKSTGIKKTVLLTGDQEPAAAYTARALDIEEYHYGLLPADKVAHLDRLIAERDSSGKGRVAFVGDGINDAPVIRAADIGIAMGGLGSDAAIEAADVVVMNDALEKIPLAVEIARFTKRIVIQNIVLALGIKILVIILGTAGAASLWEAVFADVGVALLAVLNATRVLKFRVS
jgi:Cd2+/Zn2+-exporting ATPase